MVLLDIRSPRVIEETHDEIYNTNIILTVIEDTNLVLLFTPVHTVQVEPVTPLQTQGYTLLLPALSSSPYEKPGIVFQTLRTA